MTYGLTFDPFIPLSALLAAAAVAALIAGLLLATRTRGAVFRALALCAGLLALANPSLTREEREPLTSVAAVVVDKSASQDFGDRTAQTEAARAALVEKLQRIGNLEVRVIEANARDGESDGTRLFAALSAGLADVPPERVAGAVMITDGRIHDVPSDPSALGFSAPVHGLITGRAGEKDRRVALEKAPRFGIVGQRQALTFRVTDEGLPAGTRLTATVRRDGEVVASPVVTTGQPATVEVEITHAGPNIVEVEVPPLADELTQVNNRVAVSIDGVRDKLRVLLVSGEPNVGERTLAQPVEERRQCGLGSTSPSCAHRRSRTARPSTNCR